MVFWQILNHVVVKQLLIIKHTYWLLAKYESCEANGNYEYFTDGVKNPNFALWYVPESNSYIQHWFSLTWIPIDNHQQICCLTDMIATKSTMHQFISRAFKQHSLLQLTLRQCQRVCQSEHFHLSVIRIRKQRNQWVTNLLIIGEHFCNICIIHIEFY